MYSFHQFVLEALYTIKPYVIQSFTYIAVFVEDDFYYVVSTDPIREIKNMKYNYKHINWYNLYVEYVIKYRNTLVNLSKKDGI